MQTGRARRRGILCAIMSFFPVVGGAEDHFELLFEGPEAVCGQPGTEETIHYLARLAHEGEGSGASAYSFVVEVDSPDSAPVEPHVEIVEITLDDTDVLEFAPDSRVDAGLIPGGGAAAIVTLLAGEEPVTLPPNAAFTIARITLRFVHPADPVPPGGWKSTPLRWISTFDGPDGVLETLIHQMDRPFVPETSDLALHLCEIAPDLREPGGALFINSGGEDEVIDGARRFWHPDASFLRPQHPSTSVLATPEANVDLSLLLGSAVPHEMLTSERWRDGDLHYQIPVTGQDYEVTLYFSENWPAAVGPELGGTGCLECERLFDVEVEGNSIHDYSVADEAAGSPDDGQGRIYAATALRFTALVSDGLLDIRIVDKGAGNPPQNASIKGVAVVALEPAGPPVEEPLVLDWPMLREATFSFGWPELEGVVAEANALVPTFVRGDCDGDGDVSATVTDAVFLLAFLFLGGAEPPCLAACDVNGDGDVGGSVTDAVRLLTHRFLGGDSPPPPFPNCGPGFETDAALGCAVSDACAQDGGFGRELFRGWLHEQFVEGPEVGLRVGDFLRDAADIVASRELEERGRLVSSLYLELVNVRLPLREPPFPLPEVENGPFEATFPDVVSPLSVGPSTLLTRDLLDHVQFEPTDSEVPLAREQYVEQTGPGVLPGLTTVPYLADAGHVPPNFVHTWALELEGLDTFKLGFRSLSEVMLVWQKPGQPSGAGDRITVRNLCGDILGTFDSLHEVQTRVVTLAACQWDTGGRKRVYITLETGSAPFKGRRFSLRALRNTKSNTGAEKALVLADRFNYETKEVFAVAFESDGTTVDPLYPPWGNNENGVWIWDNPMGKDASGKLLEEGWHLVGENLTELSATKKYYSLVYYNDITSKLRLYLLNKGLPSLATHYQVELSLQARLLQKQSAQGVSATFQNLQGAFFPIHPDPEKWSTAQVSVPRWELNEWTQVDVPLLYPMASNLLDLMENPYVKKSSVHDLVVTRYHSVYEDRMKANRRNMRLCVTVRAATTSSLNAELVGKAIGQAVQTQATGDPDPFKVFEDIYDGFDKGKEWYDSAEKAFKSAKDFLEPNASNDAIIKYVVSGGASLFSGIAGMAGFAVSILGDLLGSEPEPLQLAMELALQGMVNGKVVSLGVGQSTCFYFPGRFSIGDALRDVNQGGEGLAVSNAGFVDSVTPRFGRTLGLFGYEFNPSRIAVKVERKLPIWRGSLEIVFPKEKQDAVSNLLPVIRNPFGEITVQWSLPHIAAFDTSPILWEPCGPVVGDFCPRSSGPAVGVAATDKPMEYTQFADRRDLDTFSVDHGFHLKQNDWTFAERKGIAPLHDVMYYWEVIYTYNGPSRLKVAQFVWTLGEQAGSGIDPVPCPPNCATPWEYATLRSPVRVELHKSIPPVEILDSALLKD